MFSGDIEIEHWPKICQNVYFEVINVSNANQVQNFPVKILNLMGNTFKRIKGFLIH